MNAKLILGKGTLLLKKYTPEILLGAGLVLSVAGTIKACETTYNKLDDIKKKKEEAIEAVEDAFEKGITVNGETYDEKDYNKDLFIIKAGNVGDYIKAYAPSTALILGSMSCILGSFGIIRGRNAALVAAYNAVESAYDGYRNRVREEIGEEKENDIYRNIKNHKMEVTKEVNGKEKKIKEDIKYVDDLGYSKYARFFDETNPKWHKSADTNYDFLRLQERYLNDLLQARGYVFLNEVYDTLGFPITKEGQMVGWYWDKDNCNRISFGLTNTYRTAVRDFINGYEPCILLDFNVDGIIFNKF